MTGSAHPRDSAANAAKPSDEEAVAIAAAVQALWPVPVIAVDEQHERDTTWKFSGRWWSRPVPSRRNRPYR